MKNWVISILLLNYGQYCLANTMTLKQIFEQALQKTDFVEVQDLKNQQLQMQIKQKTSVLYPQLSLDGLYSKQDSTTTPEVTYTKLKLSQSLYEGGKDQAAIELSENLKKSQISDSENSKIKFYLTVATVYYNLQSSQKEVENIKNSLNLMQDRIKEISKRLQIGRSRQSELLNAQSQLASLQSQLLSAEKDYSVALNEFQEQTAISDLVTFPKSNPNSFVVKSKDTYIQLALQRPEMKSLEAELGALEQSTKIAKAGHLPTLDLTGNYYLSRTGSTLNKWDVGVALSIPLFEGGRVRYEVQESELARTEATIEYKQKKRQIENEISAHYDTLVAQMEQIKSLEKALWAAEKNYLEQKKDYQFSLVTNLDVLQALTSFQETQRAYDKMRIEAHKTFISLHASSGQIEFLPETL